MKRFRAKLTYANVISTICLFLVLGGGAAFAATQLPKNSVGSKQIKKEAVTPAKLSTAAKATLTGPKGATGATGANGAPGAKGDKGDQGLQGVPGNANVVTYNLGPHNFGTEATFTATLPGTTSIQEWKEGAYQVQMAINPSLSYPVPGFASGGSTNYRVFLREGGPTETELIIQIVTGTGESYSNIGITRIKASSIVG